MKIKRPKIGIKTKFVALFIAYIAALAFRSFNNNPSAYFGLLLIFVISIAILKL